MARQLAADHTDLVIVARDEARLASLAEELSAGEQGVDVEVLVADLSNRAALGTVEARLCAEDRPIDLLVNNAGFGRGGPFVDNDIDVECSVIEVNLVALTRLAHAAATTMASRGRGGILNVSSLAGELVAPESAVYSATKAYVTSLTESIHQELAPAGVVVTAVLPGLTRTEFQERAEVDVSKIPDQLWQTPEAVAAEGLAALAAGRVQVTTGVLNKVANGLVKFGPKIATRAAGRQVMLNR